VPVTNTPGILADEVADLAIGLMLASARQILFADRYVRDGSWAEKGPIPLGRSVGGKTMGVLGLGGIGRAIADRGAAFRMRVIYGGPRRKADAPYEYVADPVELARQSDYLMVACKGGPETRHLVSAAVIDALGPQGTLVNVARGSVVDEPGGSATPPSTCSRARQIPPPRCLRCPMSSCSRTMAAPRWKPAPRSGSS
jgi:lactate dehydrogenase-like 2-hydroxyacid dehydrogenase